MPQRLTTLGPEEELQFQQWYQAYSRKANLDPDPDNPQHFYDYRGAWESGWRPTEAEHGPSRDPVTGKMFKLPGHPTMWKTEYMDRTGRDPDEQHPQGLLDGDIPPDGGLLSDPASRKNKNNNWNIDLSGGGGYSKNLHPSGIRQTALGVGGRAGMRIPLGNYLDALRKWQATLGVSGYFGKSIMDLPDKFVQQGAPERINNISKRLTGVDASLQTPGGTKFGFTYKSPRQKERELMLRLTTPFNYFK